MIGASKLSLACFPPARPRASSVSARITRALHSYIELAQRELQSACHLQFDRVIRGYSSETSRSVRRAAVPCACRLHACMRSSSSCIRSKRAVSSEMLGPRKRSGFLIGIFLSPLRGKIQVGGLAPAVHDHASIRRYAGESVDRRSFRRLSDKRNAPSRCFSGGTNCERVCVNQIRKSCSVLLESRHRSIRGRAHTGRYNKYLGHALLRTSSKREYPTQN